MKTDTISSKNENNASDIITTSELEAHNQTRRPHRKRLTRATTQTKDKVDIVEDIDAVNIEHISIADISTITADIQDQVYDLESFRQKAPSALMQLAECLKINNSDALKKHDLIFVIIKRLTDNGNIIIGSGIIEVMQDGFGFLRSTQSNYVPGPDDIYVSPSHIKRYGIRTGDKIRGRLRAPRKSERYFALVNIEKINDAPIAMNRLRTHFDDLTPIFPNVQICLENKEGKHSDISSRVIDITSPLGLGQRALVVAPPRTGKTVLMQNIAHAITNNYPDINLIVLLIGERPEEVTDMARSVKGEVVSSTFDEPSQRHTQLAEMVIEKAKRMVESKKDVVILLDSITRLARAYNDIAPSSGRVLSGGVDSNALQRPKRFFGAARNIEEGGSLTIIATSLIETGSRMDEVIFEEFKGTGNAEIVLDRKVADRRIFPAIDIVKSGTRREELLLQKNLLSKIWVLRRITNPMGSAESIEFLLDKLKINKSNAEFFAQMDTYNPANKKKVQ